MLRDRWTGVIAAAVWLALGVSGVGAAEREKVVIIGFDGADAGLVSRWMDAGELPNLAKLRDEGTFAPLEPTNPPQTPVSWSSFATGTNPGKTQIFDFLKRDPNDYKPDFAMMSEQPETFLFGERNALVLGLIAAAAALVLFGAAARLRLRWRWAMAVGLVSAVAAGLSVGAVAQRYLPLEVPSAVNNRQGRTMWSLASEAGLKVQVIRVPATFPAEPVPGGHMLSGLGVPDMRGRVGTPAFYTSEAGFKPADNDFSLELLKLPARRGTIETQIVGPYNKPFYDYEVKRRTRAVEAGKRSAVRRRVQAELEDAGVTKRLDLPLRLEVTDTTCTVRVGDTRPDAPGR